MIDLLRKKFEAKEVYVSAIGDRRVVASVSGGKDSAALSLWLTEQGIDHDRVFMDTGWEHPKTYEYLRGELTRVIGPIVELRGSMTLPELALKKGIFPGRRKRYCTQLLKFEPFRDYVRALPYEVVNAVGIRGEESADRAAMKEWEWNNDLDCEFWRPLIGWSFDEVVAIHRRHDLRPNPLYLMGANRVGCFPCINAGRTELRLMGSVWPERVDEIRRLEAEVNEVAKAKVQARGEDLEHERTFFRERKPGAKSDIDSQMRWAGTGELDFWPKEQAGCMRWGMCETEPEE